MKHHDKGAVLFATFTVEQGLLLLCNPLCIAIVKSCLAAAQELFPLRICHLLVEATHLHILLVVHNPDDIPKFIRHFKADTAHFINKILGRRKRTVWEDGYDSPRVLSLERSMSAITYLYADPAKDNLVNSIDEYPGFSTWEMYRSGRLDWSCKRLRRPMFRELPQDMHNLEGYSAESQRLYTETSEMVNFKLEPNAWIEAFGYTDTISQDRINQRLYDRVRRLEQRALRVRARNNRSVLGHHNLTHQVFDLSYNPSRRGRRSICLSDRREQRLRYESKIKQVRHEARRVYGEWRGGNKAENYPPGLYPPSMPKLANVVLNRRD